MGVLIYSLVGISSAFVAVQRILGGGFRIPLRKGFYIRRWVQPTNQRQCDIIVNQLQDVCRGSIGCLFKHPVLEGNPNALSNRVALIAYNKDNIPVMFNLMLLPNKSKHKVLHYGLVMVKEDYKGKKLQTLKHLNMMSMLLSKPTYLNNSFVTALGDSPSVARSMPSISENVYPDYNHPQNTPKPEYREVVTHLLDKHREEMSVSSKAELDLDTFVVKNSNDPSGGGASDLVPHSENRKSSNAEVNEFLYKRLNPETYDEMFFVGMLTPLQIVKNIIYMWSLFKQIDWTSLSKAGLNSEVSSSQESETKSKTATKIN